MGKAVVSGDHLEVFQYAIVRGSLWTPQWQALECPTGSSQVGGGGSQLLRVGCTQIQGDPFPHFLSLGVPAEEERRGTVAERERKSLQIRVGTAEGKSGFSRNFQKPFVTAVPGEPAGREDEEPLLSQMLEEQVKAHQ